MRQPYIDVAQIYFPNAKIVINKYHFIRQVGWAIELIRKRLQKSMPKKLRKYFKHSRRLILIRYYSLSDDKKQECDLMLLYNDDLRKAHSLKEMFHEICQNSKYSEQRTDFWNWIKEAESSGIPEFEKCAKTYRNWSKYILNAYKHSHEYSCAIGSSAIIRYYCYIPCTSTLLQATACHIFHTLYVLSFLICY